MRPLDALGFAAVGSLIPTGIACPPALILPLTFMGVAAGKRLFDHKLPEYGRYQEALSHYYGIRGKVDEKIEKLSKPQLRIQNEEQKDLEIDEALWLVHAEESLKKDVMSIVEYKMTNWSKSIEKVLEGTSGILKIDYKDHEIETANEMRETVNNKLASITQQIWDDLDLKDKQKEDFLSKISPRFKRMEELQTRIDFFSKIPVIKDSFVPIFEKEMQKLTLQNRNEFKKLKP